MASFPQPREAGYTYGDYLRWTDEGRWELIDGVVYDMSAAPAIDHQRLIVELVASIHTFLSDRECEVFVAPFDVRLPHADEADEAITDVVQPDIAVVCDPEKLDKRGCRGAPDWIIEILSPSTAAKDHIEKLALYERSGVKEYWVVYPAYGIIDVHLLGDDGRYEKPKSYAEKDKIEPATLPGLILELKTIFKSVLG
jgi:Uma2 family endonuclease